MPSFPSVFYSPTGQPYAFGIAAAGALQALPADVALTGSPVRQFSQAVDAALNFVYDFEANLYLNVTGAGIVTTVTGVTTGSPVNRQIQLTQTTATAPEQRSSVGTGDQTIASSSISTGTRSIIIRGSAKPTVAGAVFLDVSTGGTVTLLAGSTFRVWRTE